MTRGCIPRRLLENKYATAITTRIPSIPVKRCIETNCPILADDFEDQLTTFRCVRRNAESVFDKLRGFVDVVLPRVVQAAQHATRIYLLPDFHFQNHSDRRI